MGGKAGWLAALGSGFQKLPRTSRIRMVGAYGLFEVVRCGPKCRVSVIIFMLRLEGAPECQVRHTEMARDRPGGRTLLQQVQGAGGIANRLIGAMELQLDIGSANQ
jgi:hypothetical protein